MCICFSNRKDSYLDKEVNASTIPNQTQSPGSSKSSQTNKEILVSHDSPICHIKRCSVDTNEYRYRIFIHNKAIVAHNRRSCSHSTR